MRRIARVPLLLLLAACASAPSQNPYRPQVTIEQLNELNFGATTRAPVTVEVHVQNKAIYPIALQIVRLEGTLSQQYLVAPVQHAVTQVIPPGETRSVRIPMTAVSQQGRIDFPEPLNLRGFITYTVGEQQYQDLYVFRSIVQ